MKKIKLYVSDMCPFCHKVVDFIEEQGISGVEFVDASRSLELQKLIYEIGGKSQVPMMTIDGQPMYESDDIINWLKENM